MKILIGDDHQVVRTGLSTYFKQLGYFDITGATSCNQIMKELSLAEYSHCVLDVILPDGSILEVLPNIQRLYPETGIAVFSMQPPEIYRGVLRQYGVDYYIPKSFVEDEMLELFKKFLNDEPYPYASYEEVLNPFSSLSARELEVLHYLLKNKNPVEISGFLNLSANSVYTYRTRILKKTMTKNNNELSELATLYNLG